MSAVAEALRVAYPKALSTLVRVTGSLDEAEDLLQEAAARALVHWEDAGVADNPAAWLVRTARNYAIDGYRRRALARLHAESTAASEPIAHPEQDVDEIGLRDDMLTLVFTCCHPVLTREAQVALTLKAVAGLSVEEIARAFLVKRRTIEQRITRAKKTIREAHVPYEVPSAKELPDRLASVLAVVHLIFNEGYSASIDAPIIRHDLCRLAIGQAHLLYRLFPGEAEVEGLLALLLLSHSRAPARVSAGGAVIPLDHQDRALWNRVAINEGLALLDSALRRCRPGPYQIQAAISATHCRASRWEDTDWSEILRLYDALLALTPSPVVKLGRAVAVSRVEGAQVGLERVEALAQETGMAESHSFDAVRAGLLEELERWEEALEAYHDASSKTTNTCEIRYFEGKIEEIQKKSTARVGKGRGPSSS